MSETQTAAVGFNDAVKAILAGEAKARELWIVLFGEHDRDRYALRPMPWEGAGEYQCVEYTDGRAGFVRVPDNGPFSLQRATKQRSA